MKTIRWNSGVAAIALMATASAAPSYAQDVAADAAATDDAMNADIIVTAQKRDERLVDVPQSIAVVTGDDIERFNLTDFSDIQKLVPGLDISGGTVSLRGVKFNALSLTRPTVDVYFNEVLSERAAQIQSMYDVGQIEVLRGPQGSLRAGTGPSGAILIGTRRPSLGGFDGYAAASYTDRRTLNLQGAVSVPIVTDRLAIRVAGLYDEGRGANVRNVVNGARDDNWTRSGRVSLAWEPNSDISFDLVHQQLRSRSVNLAQVEGSGPFGTFTARDRISVTDGIDRVATDTSLTTMNVRWDLPGHRLSYTGGYTISKFRQLLDSDTGNGLLQLGPVRLPVELHTNTLSKRTSWSHELRFERTGDNFWNYRFGIYRQTNELDATVLLDFTGANGACQTAPGPLAGFGLPCTFIDTTDSPSESEMGYFTTHVFNLSPSDIVEVGARRSVTPYGNAWTGSASYSHKFGRDMTVYAGWGRGFRPGGPDEFITDSNPQIPASEFGYRPEHSDNFEIGLKGLFLGGNLSLSLAAFYQKFDGYISNVQGIVCTGNPDGVGLIPGTVFATGDGMAPNGFNPCGSGSLGPNYNGDASARGVELDARLVMVAGWTSQLTVSYADAHFDNALIPCNDFNGDGTPDTDGIPAVQAGRYFSRCVSRATLGALPKWQVSANTEYVASLGGGLDGYIRALADYSPAARDPNNNLRTPSSFRVDAFAGLRLDDIGASLEIFARNLFNERTRLPGTGEIFSLFGAPTGYSPVSLRRGREMGARLQISF